ncbi:MAG: transcription termination/antitermination protein NusA [Alphaproteobacteria bacterium]|nr:transcription termination/antitermination protein NusA [Pseudomonadota bacterium]TDI65055.1 MAG: transcription termination/antitermination protein NusA [Alphaproteobacteria bacterium]
MEQTTENTPLEEEITGLARPELIQVADAVAREKAIDREEVLTAMEQAIQKAGRSRYGQERDIRAEIDRATGEITLARYTEAVEEVEDEFTQISLEAARKVDPDIELGGFLIDRLPPIDFGRIAAQTAKQVIVQKVREAERQRQYEEYKDRAGEIVSGLVKRVEFGNVTVDLGRGEAVLRRDEALPRENLRTSERVRAYIYDVREELRGPQIFLSRTRPEFMAKLFAQEVPEIYDGIIEIKSVARDPGSRAKIAVLSNDSSIDPVGACVGMRGSRVQAVVAELQGEKIDIIQWSPDPATFVVNALAPAEVTKVVLDEDQKRIDVVVPDDQLSLAIGRRGQNVRLASQLSGWDIRILTEAQESERRQEFFRSRSQMFIDALDVDDVIAHLLVTEGFSSIEQVAFVPLEELVNIEGFEEEIAQELSNRAEAYLAEQAEKFAATRRELGIADDLADLSGLSPEMVVALANGGIKTRDQLAELAGYELSGSEEEGEVGVLQEFAITESEGNAIIMEARAHWYQDDEPEEEAAGDADEPEEEAAGDADEAEQGAGGAEASEAAADTDEAAPAQSAGDQEKPGTEG